MTVEVRFPAWPDRFVEGVFDAQVGEEVRVHGPMPIIGRLLSYRIDANGDALLTLALDPGI